MNMTKRLTSLEDHNLTPREAVVLWMREAHAFGSLESYSRWLLDQPDESYPLIRMPKQVVDAVRARSKEVKDDRLRDQLYRVQKDVLFLYFLQKEAQLRAAREKEPIHLHAVILLTNLRVLMKERHIIEDMQLARVLEKGERLKPPGKAEKEARARYEARVARFVTDMEALLARVMTFLSAAQMISRTYFSGEDVLYPATRDYLHELLEGIANLNELFDDAILELEEVDEKLRERLLATVTGEEASRKGPASSPAPSGLPEVTAEARTMAERWVMSAKSEALEKLGEQREAEALATRLLREVL